MRVVGVDENGLGPQLGPLVVTALSLSVDGYEARRLSRIGKRARLHDSKETSGFGKMAHCEGVALALVERLHGAIPSTVDELLATIGLDGPLALRAPCPPGAAPRQCWGQPVSLPAFGGDPIDGRRRLARLSRAGVRLSRVRCAVACPGVINAELSTGRSKLVVNLSRFERLLMDARGACDEELLAYCGMVGGIRRYEPYFTHFGHRPLSAVQEERARAVYQVAGIGEVRFEVDADATHLPVALASMVGKYVRELSVERMNRFYQDEHGDDALPRASGYHDPVTRRFVEATAPVRVRLGVMDDCFKRAR